MKKQTVPYRYISQGLDSLGTVIPIGLAEDTHNALSKLNEALGGDVSGYVAHRLHLDLKDLRRALSAEQVDSVALALYNIEVRGQSLVIGDLTGIGKGRQAAAILRYGLLAGYLPIFFTDRYTLFSDMYRDCKALGISAARPLVVNDGAVVVDFDRECEASVLDNADEIWSPNHGEDKDSEYELDLMRVYQKQYETVYQAPQKRVLREILNSDDISTEKYDYLMMTYSQLKDSQRNNVRLKFLLSLCKKRRVLFIFDEAHRGSSVSAQQISITTQCINLILSTHPQTQCVFLSATFAKRAENFITFAKRTELCALATESALESALLSGGVPMQEYVSSSLAASGQMLRREHSFKDIPPPNSVHLPR